MVKDLYLRLFFIPLLGFFLPLVSGLIYYSDHSSPVIAGSIAYFIFTSFSIWMGCNWIHKKVRPLYLPYKQLLRRIMPVCVACALYGGCIGCLSAFGWIRISGDVISYEKIIRFILACIMSVIVFTLFYEILFLTKERERDWKKVNLLDKQRSQATIYALQNEMDPHFLFNALTTLNHLIINKPEQAHAYNNKLAQVYKYFLINKNKELVPLENELAFINDYFYLLQLRYENKLQMEVRLDARSIDHVKIPPCSLQLLLENAIKHNAFSDDDPLLVVISINGQYIKVENQRKPKPYLSDSTQIGLNNLNARYKLLFNKNIIINPGKERFAVDLPIIR